MKLGFFIFLAGGVGVVLRWILVNGCKHLFPTFPLAILICNLAGCFLIGLIGGIWTKPTPLSLCLSTAFLGGFTTFSSFSFESLKLLQTQEYPLFLLNVFGSLIGGILCVWLGLIIAEMSK